MMDFCGFSQWELRNRTSALKTYGYSCAAALITVIVGLILMQTQKSRCRDGCEEKACLAVNEKTYDCTCGTTKCETKYSTTAHGLGVAFIVIGLVSMLVPGLRLLVMVVRGDFTNQQEESDYESLVFDKSTLLKNAVGNNHYAPPSAASDRDSRF